MAPELKQIINIFIMNAATAVRFISGRQLSMAELGAIKEQAIVAIQAAFLKGKLTTLKKVLKDDKNAIESTRVRYFDKLYANRQQPDPDDTNTLPRKPNQ